MESKYQHFVITRFNMKMQDWYHKDKNGNSTKDQAWLNERTFLFETFCFPSITAQTHKAFTWLCFFDEDTPEEYKKK